MMETPVVFLIFKRPDTTQKAFNIIRQAKPSKLLVVADGPRKNRIGEAEKCDAARKIIDQVDWDCEVLKNYSDINLGCAKRVASGLDWVFDNVEDAIIIEDDCILNLTFFRFAEELLERYRNDSRIFSISAQNVQPINNFTDYSYYFSRYNHCWGWATWKRAWQYFDFEMKSWPEAKSKNLLYDVLQSQKAANYWAERFQLAYDEKVDSWAYRWTLTCWLQNALSIIPNTNLVSNIGFGTESTHLYDTKSKFNSASTFEMTFPLKHMPYMLRNNHADNFTQTKIFTKKWKTQIKSA
ncbi:MAG: glycosyltransferase family 2 protein, partial [Cyanobacteria bacterium J06635_10]